MKFGVLIIAIVLILSAFLFAGQAQAQCPGPNCYTVAPVLVQPIMAAPVIQYRPAYVGQMYYTPRPVQPIRYPTPIRNWLFGTYRGGGYTATFVPRY